MQHAPEIDSSGIKDQTVPTRGMIARFDLMNGMIWSNAVLPELSQGLSLPAITNVGHSMVSLLCQVFMVFWRTVARTSTSEQTKERAKRLQNPVTGVSGSAIRRASSTVQITTSNQEIAS